MLVVCFADDVADVDADLGAMLVVGAGVDVMLVADILRLLLPAKDDIDNRLDLELKSLRSDNWLSSSRSCLTIKEKEQTISLK